MLYDNNGILLNEFVFINENKFDLRVFNDLLLLESFKDSDLTELKGLIKDCEDVQHVDAPDDKKFKMLKDKTEKILDIFSSLFIAPGTVAGIKIITTKGFNAKKIFRTCGVIMAVSFGALIILTKIASKSKENRKKYGGQLIKCAEEAMEKFKYISENDSFPEDMREKAQNHYDKLKAKVDSLK